jgi:hypothetical protein
MRAEKSAQRTASPDTAPGPIEPVAPAPAHSNGADPAGVINQVRELLFGETKRASEASLNALDARVGALAAAMNEKFAEVESRLADLARESERAQAAAIDDIGSAIASLGASIRNMSGARKAN